MKSGKRKILYSRYDRPLTWVDVNNDNLTVKTYRNKNHDISELCDSPRNEQE